MFDLKSNMYLYRVHVSNTLPGEILGQYKECHKQELNNLGFKKKSATSIYNFSPLEPSLSG